MSLSPVLEETLDYYKKQVLLAKDRLRRFECGELSVGDLGRPPHRDFTAEAIENEKAIIFQFKRGIEIIERLGALP